MFRATVRDKFPGIFSIWLSKLDERIECESDMMDTVTETHSVLVTRVDIFLQYMEKKKFDHK